MNARNEQSPDEGGVFQEIHVELRRLAASAMAHERDGHTLQPTALLSELWIRLHDHGGQLPTDKNRFLGLAAKIMRQVLVDHARGRNRLKRGGDWRPVTLGVAEDMAAVEDEVDVVELDSALHELGRICERQARVVELRFFAGLEVDEVAALMGLSPRTVAREWRFARAWLVRRMEESE